MKIRIIIIFLVFTGLLASCGDVEETIGNNSYRYDGTERRIGWAGYDELSDGMLRLILSPDKPVSNNVSALARRIEVYIPEGGLGVAFNLRTNGIGTDGRYDGWLIYNIDNVLGVNLEGYEANVDTDDILSGTLIVSKLGVNTYRVLLSAKFTNGKSLSLNYSGTFSNATTILEMPEGEGSLDLQYVVPKLPIIWGGFIEKDGLTTIALSAVVPVRGAKMSEMLGGVFVMDIPSEYMNIQFSLNTIIEYTTTDNAIDRIPWRFVYNGFEFEQIKFGCEANGGYRNDAVTGIIEIYRTEGTNEFRLAMYNIQFTDNSHLQGNWEGTLVDIEGLGLPLTMW